MSTPRKTQKMQSMSEAEWQARCDLAALYRIVSHLGWTDLLQTHMSARIPGEPNTFLINRMGDMFDEICASNLVKMDLDGNVIGDQARFNKAGFTIHSGIYKARSDAHCVMHTHTRAGAGVSLLRNALRPISQDALHVIDDVVYHEYGIPATQEECDALGVSCQKGSSVVLLNHGLLTFGHTIHGALERLYLMERACEVELIARTLDEPPVMIARSYRATLRRAHEADAQLRRFRVAGLAGAASGDRPIWSGLSVLMPQREHASRTRYSICDHLAQMNFPSVGDAANRKCCFENLRMQFRLVFSLDENFS